MIYFAGFLVLVGLLFFLYALLVATEDKPLIEPGTASKSLRAKKVNKKNHDKNSDLKEKLFNFKYPVHRNPTEMDQKIRKERSMGQTSVPSPVREPQVEKIFQDPIPFAELAEDEPDEIPLEPIELQTEPSLPKSKIVLRISGLLYLDFGRKIPFDFKKFRNVEWTEESFLHFKRVGKVEMFEHDGVVEFHAGQTTHELDLELVEQIIFYENAFTMVPTNPSLPVSLLFSPETRKFKKLITERFPVVS